MSILALLLSLNAFAADKPTAEVYGGYSFFRDYTNTDFPQNMNGWNASATANVNRYFGVTADISGEYKTLSGGDSTAPGNLTVKEHYHNFLFGPTLSYRTPKVTPFAHALFGVTHLTAINQISGPAATEELAAAIRLEWHSAAAWT
jgi:hypothetical protein